MRCDSGSLFLECLQLKVSVCVRRLSYSWWKASAVRTGSMLERSSKISFDKWRLYHALDRSSGEKKHLDGEERRFSGHRSAKKRTREKKVHSFLLTDLVSEASGPFQRTDTHTDCKHNIHIIDATERESLWQHITHTHTHSSVSVWDTKMKLPSTYEVQTLSCVEFPRRHFCRRT